MIRTARRPTWIWRHVFLTLATLAVALKVLVPAGFMVGATSDGLAFPIVLCAAQGAAMAGPDHAASGHEMPGHAPAKPAHDSPCAFAGHGLGAPAPSVHDAGAITYLAYAYLAPRAVDDLAPGRGLTGPPLPARGPPVPLI